MTSTASTPARSSSSTSLRDASASSAIASFPAGTSGKQLEQPVERLLLVLGELGREEQDLRVDLLQDALELVVVSHAHDVLDSELPATLGLLTERVVVVGRQHDGVGSVGEPLVRHRAVREQRQRGLPT